MNITKQRILALATAGLLLAPVFASSVAEGVGTTVQAVIAPTISLSNTNTTNTTLNLTGSAGVVQTTNKDTVSVVTNDSAGYTLKLADADANLELCITPGGGCTGIAVHSGTNATPTIMSAANVWGYHVDGAAKWCSAGTTCAATEGLLTDAATSTTVKYAAISNTAATLKTTAVNTAGDATDVYYGVNIDGAKASGTYTDTVVYTAIAN